MNSQFAFANGVIWSAADGLGFNMSAFSWVLCGRSRMIPVTVSRFAGLAIQHFPVAVLSCDGERSAHRIFRAEMLPGRAFGKHRRFGLMKNPVGAPLHRRQLDDLKEIRVNNIHLFGKLAILDYDRHGLGHQARHRPHFRNLLQHGLRHWKRRQRCKWTAMACAPSRKIVGRLIHSAAA